METAITMKISIRDAEPLHTPNKSFVQAVHSTRKPLAVKKYTWSPTTNQGKTTGFFVKISTNKPNFTNVCATGVVQKIIGQTIVKQKTFNVNHVREKVMLLLFAKPHT